MVLSYSCLPLRFYRFVTTIPIKQMRQMPTRTHRQPFSNPFHCYGCFRAQPRRQLHFETVSLAPIPQIPLDRHLSVKKAMKDRRRCRGFSLLELLVAISIIAVLAGLVLAAV